MIRAGRPSPAASAPARAAANRASSVEILRSLAATKAATMTARTMAAAVVAVMSGARVRPLARLNRDPGDAGEGLGRGHVPADAALDHQDAQLIVVPAVLVGVQALFREGGQLGDAVRHRGQADVFEDLVDRP